MDYNAFITEQIEIFKKRYPSAEGWQIYRNNRLLFKMFPDFLDEHPESVKSSDIIRVISHDRSYPEYKDTPNFEVKKWSWLGYYELIWKDEKVNIISISSEKEYIDHYFLIAAKSFEAVKRLYVDILEYDQKRECSKANASIITEEGTEISLSDTSWDNIILAPAMLEDLKAGIETFFKSRKEYRRFGIPYKRGFIFSGPAGCGKTLTAKTIISTMHLPAYLIIPSSSPERTAISINWAFNRAATQAPSILLIEELEKLSNKEHISMVLNLMDGLSTMKGVLVIATTNYPEKIDPALLLRPSRFDRVWHFPLPDAESRLRLLKKKAAGYFEDSVLEHVAKLSTGFSMAYVQEIFASALSFAIREGRQINDKDMIKSVETLKKQIKSANKATADVGTSSQSIGFAQV
ncbi:MAG: ATP-binding protein [Desulfobacteraceae bacterium]|nr:MAG: ATP-binding protein [Desulfobacteraceae bacterium]